MYPFSTPEKVLCQGMGWPIGMEPMVGWVLKKMGWTDLFNAIQDRMHHSDDWSEWFPTISVTCIGTIENSEKQGITLFSNHPLGFLDGWALGVALKGHKASLKMFGHPVLAGFPALQHEIIPFSRHLTTKSRQLSLHRAAQHVVNGGVLVRFAADEKAQIARGARATYWVEITPIWKNEPHIKWSRWWTWATMPKWIGQLAAVEVRFRPSYQV